MYASQIKLILQYLLYNCKSAKTYGALALTCKYAREIAKYYAPMKRKEFCRKLKKGYSLGGITYYVLPNGRVLKSVSSDIDLSLADVITTTTLFDVVNNTSFQVIDYSESGYLPEYNPHHLEYRYENKSCSITSSQIFVRIFDFNLECIRCEYCNFFHTFHFSTVRNLQIKEFYLSCHCGLPLKYYLTTTSFFKHEKRRRIINSIILYANI